MKHQGSGSKQVGRGLGVRKEAERPPRDLLVGSWLAVTSLGTRPGVPTRTWPPCSCLPEHPVHLRALLRRLLGVERLQFLEDGRGVIVVPFL